MMTDDTAGRAPGDAAGDAPGKRAGRPATGRTMVSFWAHAGDRDRAQRQADAAGETLSQRLRDALRAGLDAAD